MWGICTRNVVKVGMMRPCGLVKSSRLVKPVSAALVNGRHLTQQERLPHLSVPPLEQTCERYLSALEPLMEVEELKRTKQLVEEFQKPGGVGERLQKGLEKKALNSENWSTDCMLHDYLVNRKPLVVNSNIGTFLPRLDYRDKQGQMRCAAKAIAGIVEFKAMIDNETLPVEYVRGMPLCMKHFYLVLSSCRIPVPGKDSVVYHAKSSSPPKHITVVHNSEFFALDVYHNDGTPLTVDQLCVQLEKICNASLQTNMEPVGILTTQNRDSWSKTYMNLIKDKTNKESVSAIERSIFTLCLDGPLPQESDDMYNVNAAKQILHGGGSQSNSGNRWFDKSMQLIIGEDGVCGGNGSHTIADGTIFMSLSDFFAQYMKKSDMTLSPMVPLPMPQKLHFNITPEIKKDIEEAKHHMDILAQDLDLRTKVFDHFGKDVIKALKMSPDAFMQMAIQLAYYRMYQRCSSVYEASSLRLFRMGRTDVIRATTSASAAFIKAFDDPRIQNTEKVDLLKKAVKLHASLSYMAVVGQGIDLHLMGLRTQAVEEKIPMPDFFTDSSYTKTFDFDLSTSQVPSKSGFIPVTCVEKPNGYDLSYAFMKNHINFVATAINTYKETNAAHLLQVLEDALLDMKTLLEQTPRV